MNKEKERAESTSFEEELPKLLHWFSDTKHLLPHVEAILAWGLSQPYQHNSTLPSLKRALDNFIGIKLSGLSLLMSLGFPEALEYQKVKDKGLDTSDFLKWLDGLRGRFQEPVRRGLLGDQYPKELVAARFNQDKEGVGLLLVRGDGDKLEVIIPYEQVTEFLLRFLSEAGKAAKIKPEEMEQLRNKIDSLMAMMGKAVKND